MSNNQVNLLTNGSATGSAMTWHGGKGTFCVEADTWNSATVTLQWQEPQSTTWVSAGASGALTDNGIVAFDLAPGMIRALVSGSPTNVNATAVRNR